MLRVNLTTGVAMALVLLLAAAVLLQVAAPHLRWRPRFLGWWARQAAALVGRLRDGALDAPRRGPGRRPRTR